MIIDEVFVWRFPYVHFRFEAVQLGGSKGLLWLVAAHVWVLSFFDFVRVGITIFVSQNFEFEWSWFAFIQSWQLIVFSSGYLHSFKLSVSDHHSLFRFLFCESNDFRLREILVCSRIWAFVCFWLSYDFGIDSLSISWQKLIFMHMSMLCITHRTFFPVYLFCVNLRTQLLFAHIDNIIKECLLSFTNRIYLHIFPINYILLWSFKPPLFCMFVASYSKLWLLWKDVFKNYTLIFCARGVI